MGRVFSWPDIEAGQIPKITDFPVVVRHIRKVIEAEDSIAGALLCGSVLRGDHNCRSDIDCVVIYNTKSERRAMEVLQGITEFASKRYVPVGFVPCDSSTVLTRFHHLGPAFCIHLQTAIQNGGVISANPLDLLGEEGGDMISEVEWYLRTKLYRLQEGLAKYPSMSMERKCGFLQKSLEAPSHVARKMLHLFDKDKNDSKKAIVDRYCAVMPHELGQRLVFLTSTDADYTRRLREQLKHPDREQYQDAWEIIEQTPYWALNFLRESIVQVNKLRA